MCKSHTLCIFFSDRPEIPHPFIFIKYIILYQVVWNTVLLIYTALTWILNEQSWLMNVPCSTKIKDDEWMKQKWWMMNEWNKNWMKLTAGILLVYIQDEIYFLNKQCKRKIPYPRPVLFSFTAWQETELMEAFKCWANCILFWSVM